MITLAQFNRLDLASKSSIDSIINAHKAAYNWVGMSVGIIKDGEVAFLDGYGLADKSGIVANEHSVYRLGSMSKCFTGVLTLKLIEMGLLNLHDSVYQIVPEFLGSSITIMGFRKRQITIEHLLSNESGLNNFNDCDNLTTCSLLDTVARTNYINSHGNFYDPITAVNIFSNQTIFFTPGSAYLYSTQGFNLLAAVIERVSNSTYQDFLFDNIACPMNMPTLQIEFQDRVPYNYEVTGYEYTDTCGTSTQNQSDGDISYFTGGGGLNGSVIDVSLFMKGLINNTLLNDTTVTFMGTEHNTTYDFVDSSESPYGYGICQEEYSGDSILQHSGSVKKTSTRMYFSPESNNGVVVMFNTYHVNNCSTSTKRLCKDIYNVISSSSLSSSSPVFSPLLNTWDVPPTSTHINPGTYESNYRINSTGQVHSGDNTQLKANKKIYLKTGFEVLQGADFKAKVNNCD